MHATSQRNYLNIWITSGTIGIQQEIVNFLLPFEFVLPGRQRELGH